MTVSRNACLQRRCRDLYRIISTRRSLSVGVNTFRFGESSFLLQNSCEHSVRRNFALGSFSFSSKRDYSKDCSNENGASEPNPNPKPNQAYAPDERNLVLEQVAAVGNRLIELRTRQERLHVALESSTSDYEHTMEIQEAMAAAETLLNATNTTIDLFHEIRLARMESNEKVAALHCAFLTVAQWCLTLATDEGSNRSGQLLLENPLLDSVMRLSVRARQLALPFHLPLYKRLASTVAQQSSMNSPAECIMQIAEWVYTEFGPLSADFFSQSLLALTSRQRLPDVVHLLKGMHTVYQIDHLEEHTTKGLLCIMKGTIQSMWKNHLNPSTLEQDTLEIILLLEPSIWKICGYDPLDRTKGRLRDAIEVIISTEKDTGDSRRDLEEFLADESFLERNSGNGTDFVADEFIDTFLEECVPGRTGSRDLDFKISRSGDETLLELSEVLSPDEVGQKSDFESSLIYTRTDAYRDLPDLASQLHEKNGGKALRYSKEFEKHLYHQFGSSTDKEIP